MALRVHSLGGEPRARAVMQRAVIGGFVTAQANSAGGHSARAQACVSSFAARSLWKLVAQDHVAKIRPSGGRESLTWRGLEAPHAVEPNDEARARWNAFLRFARSTSDFTEAQRRALLFIWATATAVCPSVTYPTVDLPESGILFVGWRPDHATLEFEIDRDGNVEWFFKNYETRVVDASDGPVETLPDHVFEYFTLFARKRR